MIDQTNLLLIFLTGLTTGGLTCLAVQGGLLASVLNNQERNLEKKLTEESRWLPIGAFVISKLLAYTLLGAVLGLAGSVVSLSPVLRGWMQIAIGVYLVGIAGAMLQLHPIFRYFIFTPPKFLARILKNQSKSKSVMAPAMLGALTIFIPCATTQAMEIVALGTGKPLYGAAVMFAFVLGTSPTFAVLGFLYSKASEKFSSWFPKVAGALLLLMAMFSINGGLAVMGSIYTAQNFWKAMTATGEARAEDSKVVIKNVVQEVTINVSSYGYTPSNITLKSGVKTRLKLITNNTAGCSRAFTIPALRLQKILPTTGEQTLEFTPSKTGPLVFSCSMGMYTGTFNVI